MDESRLRLDEQKLGKALEPTSRWLALIKHCDCFLERHFESSAEDKSPVVLVPLAGEEWFLRNQRLSRRQLRHLAYQFRKTWKVRQVQQGGVWHLRFSPKSAENIELPSPLLRSLERLALKEEVEPAELLKKMLKERKKKSGRKEDWQP